MSDNIEHTASQVIAGDQGHAGGGGLHIPEQEVKPEPEAKPLSTREAIAKAFDDQAKPEEKAETKAEEKPTEEKPVEDKAEKPRGESGKFAKADVDGSKAELDAEGKPKAGQADDAAQRPSEGRGKHAEPPARFLPEARAKWANVPNEIKAEFHRVTTESENETARLRQEYEPISRYAEMARASGTTLDKALEQYVGMEQMLRQDFGKGIQALAQNSGLQPAQAIGAMLRAFNVTPQMLAQAAQQNPNAFAAPQYQPQRQAPQESEREQQLAQENAQLRQQAASATLIPVVEAFKASRPDFPQLEPQIATILKSGLIEQMHGNGLTAEQKLGVAYRMAGGQGSPSQSEPEAPAAAPHSNATTTDPAGSLSVRGAPGSGQSQSNRRFKSNREALEAAMFGR